MKFCTHCGSEMYDNAVVCVKCGCAVDGKSVSGQQQGNKSYISIIFGIIGIVFAWIFALIGHIASIVGIVFGIKEYKETEKMAGLVLSIVGEVCSIFSSIIGAVVLSSVF